MAEQTFALPIRQSTRRDRQFAVTTTDSDGNRVTETLRAPTRSRLRMELTAAGRQVVEIADARHWWTPRRVPRVPARVLLDTTRQLAAFSEAGISILDALGMISDSTANKQMERILRAMAEDIRDGETLPQAVRTQTGVFPDYYIAMLEAADRTGNVAATFETLATYLERDTASRRAVKSALAYPVILVALGFVAVVVLSVVVLPRFVDFFNDLDAVLPLPTRMLLAGTAFVAQWWLVIIGGLVLITLLGLLIDRTESGGHTFDRLKLHVPIIGPLLRDIALERFTRVLSNLSGAGVPLIDALDLSATVVGNRHYARAVRHTRDGVMSGKGLAEPMMESAAFPIEAVQVLRVGEQTGRLTEQLEHAARFYAREVDYRLKTLTALLEPVALLIVGGAVGFVAVALVSAMYGIYSTTAVTG